MRNFTRALRAVLAEPPHMTQTDFANRCGIERTKLSRILGDFTQADRDDLDAFLQALPAEAEEARTRLVNAFVKDMISYGAMLQMRGKGGDKFGRDLDGFSPKVVAGLRQLSHSSRRIEVEPVLLSLIEAFKD